MVTDTAVRSGGEAVFKHLALHAGEILRRLDLPRSISFKELAAHPDAELASYVRHLGRDQTDMSGAETMWGYVQGTMMGDTTWSQFPDLTRKTFGGTVTSPVENRRPVIILDEAAFYQARAHGPALLSDIRYAADLRCWHTISPCGPHWVPGTEAVDPAKLARRLRQLSTRTDQVVGLLIDGYEEFSSRPGARKAIKTARELGVRIFVVCQQLSVMMRSDSSFLPGIVIRAGSDGTVQELPKLGTQGLIGANQAQPAPRRRSWNLFGRRWPSSAVH